MRSPLVRFASGKKTLWRLVTDSFPVGSVNVPSPSPAISASSCASGVDFGLTIPACRPLVELDLCHEFRPNPVRRLIGARRDPEWRLRGFDGPEPPVRVAQ